MIARTLLSGAGGVAVGLLLCGCNREARASRHIPEVVIKASYMVRVKPGTRVRSGLPMQPTPRLLFDLYWERHAVADFVEPGRGVFLAAVQPDYSDPNAGDSSAWVSKSELLCDDEMLRIRECLVQVELVPDEVPLQELLTCSGMSCRLSGKGQYASDYTFQFRHNRYGELILDSIIGVERGLVRRSKLEQVSRLLEHERDVMDRDCGI